MDCHFLLQGIFLTQELNPNLLHWQVDSLTKTEPPGKSQVMTVESIKLVPRAGFTMCVNSSLSIEMLLSL